MQIYIHTYIPEHINMLMYILEIMSSYHPSNFHPSPQDSFCLFSVQICMSLLWPWEFWLPTAVTHLLFWSILKYISNSSRITLAKPPKLILASSFTHIYHLAKTEGIYSNTMFKIYLSWLPSRLSCHCGYGIYLRLVRFTCFSCFQL